jgi:hypothetical protein
MGRRYLDKKGTPLWRSLTKERGLGDARMSRQHGARS